MSSDALENLDSASSLAFSHCALCLMRAKATDFSGSVGLASVVIGARVEGSSPIFKRRFFRLVVQKFLISLSVLPGSCEDMEDHMKA